MTAPSTRAAVVTRRSYNRPLDDAGTIFETWEQTCHRVRDHQQWLWERALDRPLNKEEEYELDRLELLLLRREATVSGRTLWLGGTSIARTREASQFNCAFSKTTTVSDVVDQLWNLLQGTGQGFEPVTGILSGFTKPMEIRVIPSEITMDDWKAGHRGSEENFEDVYTHGGDGETIWHIRIGDSAEAWAKAAGKVLANKVRADVLILDFSQIRPAGIRLKGYGWISSGYTTYAKALSKIAEIMNRQAGELLTRIDILDIVNWLGTILSSRRSAEIALMPFDDPESEAFALAKKDYWSTGNEQRGQSNNSIVFSRKPSKLELRAMFGMMMEAGGSEPGFINGENAIRRAPWWKGVNPCAEIALGDKSYCNLVEVDLGKFNGRFYDLLDAYWLIARANYRQTCVDLRDGVLQDSWHELNQFLRLCGVGATGIVRWEHHLSPKHWQALKGLAYDAANSMADELGLPRPKAVTTVKPSGTLSKIMDTTEGVHKPLGKYIFNNIRFSSHDPLLDILKDAGYRVFPDPYDETGMLVTFPVAYEDVVFDEVTLDSGRTVEVNLESAVDQLNRYKLIMDNYVDKHNCSITVSYSPEEVPEIIDWIYTNWDSYVGVSFIYRNDPTKTAADLGYPYLPQEVVTKEEYEEYVKQLKPFDLNAGNTHLELEDADCATGACPIR